ncbi:MAG: sugar transferase [Planctomycetes bacterium]|nr:sugar transferase [Planctomycetota bacterium]
MDPERRTPDLSVIVVHYDTPVYLRTCLDSLAEDIKRVDRPIEVLIIDNASPQDPSEWVRKDYPEFRVIVNAINGGFSKGVNQGFVETSGKYRLVLNADIILQQDSINGLIDHLDKNPAAGIAAPKLLNPDRTTQQSVRKFYTLRTILYRRTPLGNSDDRERVLAEHMYASFDHESVMNVDWVLGAAMCIRGDAIDKVGYFDERYFLYLEDVDYCRRMHDAGYEVHYAPGAKMIHYHLQKSRRSLFSKDALTHFLSMIKYYGKWSDLYFSLKSYMPLAFSFLLLAADVGILWASFFAAFEVRESLGSEILRPAYPVEFYREAAIATGAAMVLCFFRGRLYQVRREWTHFDVFSRSLVSGFIATCVVVMLGMFVVWRDLLGVSRLVILLYVLFAGFSMYLLRALSLFVLGRLGKYRLSRKSVVIVGTHERAVLLSKELSKAYGAGYDVVGFVGESEEGKDRAKGISVLGSISQLPEIVSRGRIQDVIFADIEEAFEVALEALVKLSRSMTDVKVLVSPSVTMLLVKSEDFYGFSILRYDRRPLLGLWMLLKRLFDLATGLACFAVCLPPLILYAISLLIFRRCPVFRVARRLGRFEKEFRTLEFYYDEINKPGIACRLQLDKALLFLPVIFGTMSLVGPKALDASRAGTFKSWERSRFEVKPGLTGLWQIKRERHWTVEGMLKLDAFYVLHWSLFLDLKILVNSFGVLLRGRVDPHKRYWE